MQYTIISLLALCLSAAFALRLKLPPKPILLVCFLSIFFQLLFDNLMTAVGLWHFDFSQTLGIAVPVIPVENLFFGLALSIFTVASWEKAKN